MRRGFLWASNTEALSLSLSLSHEYTHQKEHKHTRINLPACTQAFVAMLVNAIDVTRRRAFLTHPQKVYGATLRVIQMARREFVREVQVRCLLLCLSSNPNFR